MNLKIIIFTVFLMLSFSFSEVWFDGVYLNSKVEISLKNNVNNIYWIGENGLIKAEKNLINFMVNNNLTERNCYVEKIFLYKNYIKNGEYTIWLKKILKLKNFKNIKPINTGLAIVLKDPEKVNLHPIIRFQNGDLLKKFQSTPLFFTSIFGVMQRGIVGCNPLIINALYVKKENIILANEDEKTIMNAKKVFNFIKFNRIAFIVER